MARVRCLGLTVLALTLAAQTARSEKLYTVEELPSFTTPCSQTRPAQTRPAAADGLTCAVYSLADMGDDPAFGQWVAETIPAVIAPKTWGQPGQSGNKHVIRYYGPRKVLVVYHTPAVHAQIDAFLKDFKKTCAARAEKTAAAERTFARDRAVVPASFIAPVPSRPVQAAATDHAGYPVPAPARRPKHLFHFIIRYEGEGIIDDNVVKYFKTQQEPEKKDKDDKPAATATGCLSSSLTDTAASLIGAMFGAAQKKQGCCIPSVVASGLPAPSFCPPCEPAATSSLRPAPSTASTGPANLPPLSAYKPVAKKESEDKKEVR